MNTRRENITTAKTQLIIDCMQTRGSDNTKIEHLGECLKDKTQEGIIEYLQSDDCCCKLPLSFCSILESAEIIGIIQTGATQQQEDVVAANWLYMMSRHILLLVNQPVLQIS